MSVQPPLPFDLHKLIHDQFTFSCDYNKPPEYVVDTDSTLAYRSILLITGAWWALGTIVPAVLIQPRPGPPLPRGRTYIGVSLSNGTEKS